MTAQQHTELQQVIFHDREFGCAAFARKHGITVRSLYHWRTKLGMPVQAVVAMARRNRSSNRSSKMFTVRAEIDPRDGTGVRNVALFSAHSVRVTRNKEVTSPGNDHKWNVELYDVNQHMIESLPIGDQLDHYRMAFIMNEQGQTVNRVLS